MKVEQEIKTTPHDGIMIVKDKNHMPTHLNQDLNYVKSFMSEQNYHVIL